MSIVVGWVESCDTEQEPDPTDTTTYTWNARNQLASLSGLGLTASFQYDVFGRRLAKTINSTTTEFVYDGFNPVQELVSGTPTANLLTGLGIDEYFSRTDATGTGAFLPDALGSILALTDSAGTVQTEYTYEPFGTTTASGASSTNAFQYTGRENDETEMYYYRARYYHPTLQRFISEDPIEFLGGDINLYNYVFNNPINFVDPSGQVGFFFVPVVSGAIGAAGAVGGVLLGGGNFSQAAAAGAIGFAGGFFGGLVGPLPGLGAAIGSTFGGLGGAAGGSNICGILGAVAGGAFGGAIGTLPGGGTSGALAGAGLGTATATSLGLGLHEFCNNPCAD